MKALYKKLYSAKTKYDSAIGDMEAYLSDKVSFEEYYVLYQPSDGFVLGLDNHNAPLDACLFIIKDKGVLSLEDYMNERI